MTLVVLMVGCGVDTADPCGPMPKPVAFYALVAPNTSADGRTMMLVDAAQLHQHEQWAVGVVAWAECNGLPIVVP